MSRDTVAFVLLLLTLYALLGQRYAAVWQSDQTLWPYAASVTPRNPLAVANAFVVRQR